MSSYIYFNNIVIQSHHLITYVCKYGIRGSRVKKIAQIINTSSVVKIRIHDTQKKMVLNLIVRDLKN
jgi:hypothetical protein